MPRFWASRICPLLLIGLGLGLFPAPNMRVRAEDAPADSRGWRATADPRPALDQAQRWRVGIPGEFERQAGLVLSWKSDEIAVIGTLLEIGQIAAQKAPLVVLVSSPEEREDAEIAFQAAKINPRNVHFLEAPVDTIWARDFGPVVVRAADGSVHFVDSDYDDGDRPQDDNIPPLLAEAMGAECKPSLLTIEGGNLLSNGAGLCLTTSKTVADNVLRGYKHSQITPLFKKMFQCRDVAILEPLVGEPTGHVDMFATFTSQDTVVIATMDPAEDPVNSAILDRNAEKLAGHPTPSGPLKVERIPMPVEEEELWRSFTNVLFFDGVLLMPTYQGVDVEMQREAAATYRRLLPGWKVRGIDCTKLIRMGGAVHCVTLNLPRCEPISEPQDRPNRQQKGRGGIHREKLEDSIRSTPLDVSGRSHWHFDQMTPPFSTNFRRLQRQDLRPDEIEPRQIFAFPDRTSFPAD